MATKTAPTKKTRSSKAKSIVRKAGKTQRHADLSKSYNEFKISKGNNTPG